MILIINMCKQGLGLSYEEFVQPIDDIVGKDNDSGKKVVHYLNINKKMIDKADKIIICGTALKDNDYIEHIEKFQWLKDTESKVLGICAGAQVIAKVFGGKIIKNKEIGVVDIEIIDKRALITDIIKNQAYALHNYGIKLTDSFIIGAKSKKSTQYFKHKEKEIYGVLFHPEVLNKEMIWKF